MDWPTTLLRLVHVLSGIAWVGSALFIVVFLEPAISATGPNGAKVMAELMQHRRLSQFMSLAALATIVAGLILFWSDSSGLQVGWMTAGEGLGLTIGGLAGLAAFVLGLAIQVPTTGRIAALGKEMQSAGGPPAPAQLAEMQRLQERMAAGGRWGLALMAISVIAMTVAENLK
jgi:uncharacterized membrane protein